MADHHLPSRLFRLCQKELKETMRDRRTIMTLVMMPLLVYPLLSMALNRFLLSAPTGADGNVVYRIGVSSAEEGEILREWIESELSLPPPALQQASGNKLARFEIGLTDPPNPRVALEQNNIDVACEITIGGLTVAELIAAVPEVGVPEAGVPEAGVPEVGVPEGESDSKTRGSQAPSATQEPTPSDVDTPTSRDAVKAPPSTPPAAPRRTIMQRVAATEMGRNTPPKVTFIAFRGDAASQTARRVLVERLQWLRMGLAEIIAKQTTPSYQTPINVQVDEVGTVEQPSMLGTIVPLVLVLMTITGAVYPAIDLTAGERERGTMESLMASPVPRSYVLFAKYVAVVTVALLTAVANLLAMFTTLWAGGLLPMLTGGESEFPWLAVLQILGLLVLFSGFFSAVLLSLTSFAKSFKEAQAYLIPVMLLSLTPGMLSLMPGVTLSGPIAIAPLINIVVLARDVLQGTVHPASALAAVISTFTYAGAALGIASKLFGSDAVTRTSQQSVTSLFQRPTKTSLVPTPQTAAMMLALLVPIYFVISNVLMRLVAGMSINSKLYFNSFALIVTFGLVPLFAAWVSRCKLKTTYRLHPPSWIAVIGAIIVGFGAWGIALESYVLADQLGIAGLKNEQIQRGLKTLELFKDSPPWLLVLTLALTPAIIEELCFRGFLFSSLSNSLSPGRLIVATSLLFGIFHVLTGNVLLLERFVPTTLLGLILGWIAYRTGSVWPGILMHFIHNALLEVVAHYHKELEFLGDGFDGQTHLPLPWLVGASIVALVGLTLVWTATTPRAKSDATPPHDSKVANT